MSNTLYELTEAIQLLNDRLEQVELNNNMTDEEKEENKNNLEEIQKDIVRMIQEKSDNIIKLIRNEETLIGNLKEEENKLKQRRVSKENKISRLKEYILFTMDTLNTTKIETNIATISKRKSPVSVEIISEDLIPTEFIKVEEKRTVDKKGILANFKENGELIDGVKIISDKYSLMIK